MHKWSKILYSTLLASVFSAGVSYSSPPFLGGGTMVFTGLELLSETHSGGNIFQTLRINGYHTGTMSGTFTEIGVIVIHPNGKATFQGWRTFEGTVNGKFGQLTIRIEGTGGLPPAEIQGQFTITEATGELRGLQGQGTSVAVDPGNQLHVDEYTGRFHFDP